MLRAEKLSKRFGGRPALDALDLDIGRGQIFCLLGANGAGKTTTINLFLGFLAPDAGAAFVDGKEVAKDAQAARARLAYVPEQMNLYPSLTGFENLAYFTKLAAGGRTAPDRLRDVLARAGLDDRAAQLRVEHYSKGMRQRVGLAIAVARNAKALLLDEPLSGLDPQAANDFCVLLRQVADAGAAVLMVTHDLFRARDVGDRIGIMKAGRLVAELATSGLGHAQLERIYLDRMRGDAAAPDVAP
jgi:ABC-2 type transport system ATP-binding protein